MGPGKVSRFPLTGIQICLQSVPDFSTLGEDAQLYTNGMHGDLVNRNRMQLGHGSVGTNARERISGAHGAAATRAPQGFALIPQHSDTHSGKVTGRGFCQPRLCTHVSNLN